MMEDMVKESVKALYLLHCICCKALSFQGQNLKPSRAQQDGVLEQPSIVDMIWMPLEGAAVASDGCTLLKISKRRTGDGSRWS